MMLSHRLVFIMHGFKNLHLSHRLCSRSDKVMKKCPCLTTGVFMCCNCVIRISALSSTSEPPSPAPRIHPAFPTSCPERLSSSLSWQKWTRLDEERTQPRLHPSVSRGEKSRVNEVGFFFRVTIRH